MLITLTWTNPGAPAPSTFVLADTPANIPMTNFTATGSRVIQEAQFFRATGRKFYDRSNRKTEITFDTTRLQTSQQAAEQFVLDHETMFPGQFLVTFSSGSGSTTTRRFLINAMVESLVSKFRGQTTLHSYRITGGVMSTTPT